MGKAALTPVIRIDEEKCINCYACITGCPVKFCMDGSGDKLQIRADYCIGCGNCITVCTHKARSLIDDTQRFIEDVRQGVKIAAVVAPAIASFFPDKFLNFNGWLKSMGVEAFFDVSLGAELTVISYLEHIKKNNPRTVIAQPCPAIVSFIEIYHPNLLRYLAPADSPMLHTVKMIKEFFPEYKNHRIAIISPCIAKRREFDETGLVDYNVTMSKINDYLTEHKIDISSYKPVEYNGIQAERAVGFSTPGGLLDTAERFVPGIRRNTNKIEGVHTIYPYLEEISYLMDKNVELPLLIDCLNCEKGCNGGPGTGNAYKPQPLLENPIKKRSAKLEEFHNPKKKDKAREKYNKNLNKYWKANLYDRTYRDLSGNNTIKIPNEAELTKIYRSMKKYGKEDLYNCTACGYGHCEMMATAIFNNLNKPEHCAHYTLALLKEEKDIGDLNLMLQEHIRGASELVSGINKLVHELNGSINLQATAVDQSSESTQKMLVSIKDTSEVSLNKQEAIKELIENAERGRESMDVTIKSIQDISMSVEGISEAIKIISQIAANTNLLSMNAAIEAAHAGEAGRGFAVVADEIRRLSESTRDNSRNIAKTLKSIIDGISVTSKQSGDTNTRITEMSKEINGFAETMTDLINTFNLLSSESGGITTSLDSLQKQSVAVKTGYTEILSMTEKLHGAMAEMTNILSDVVPRPKK